MGTIQNGKLKETVLTTTPASPPAALSALAGEPRSFWCHISGLDQDLLLYLHVSICKVLPDWALIAACLRLGNAVRKDDADQ